MKSIISAPLVISTFLLIAACGQQDSPSKGASASGPVAAAASGMAETIASAAKGSPIPRENLPDYVETREGGRYMTSMIFNNDIRSGGMLMYAAPGPLAEVVAFHRASLEKHGMTVGETTTHPVRGAMETRFEGKSADGKSTLSVSVIDKSEAEMIVQLNYKDEAN